MAWALLGTGAAAQAEPPPARVLTEPCAHISITADERIELSPSEQTLLCGDPKLPPWQDVPLTQAWYFLKPFLAARGYLHPDMSSVDGRLLVDVGPQSVVRAVISTRSDDPIDVSKYWPTVGKPMTPGVLNDLKAWTKRRLAEEGYPCANVQLDGHPDAGVIKVTITNDTEQFFPEVQPVPLVGKDADVLRRYFAFEPGQRFSAIKLDLTGRRFVENHVVAAASLTAACIDGADGVTVAQTVIPGDPHLVTAGVGFDSEEVVLADASWKNTRFGRQASSLQAAASASWRRQTMSAGANWYYTVLAPRHYLRADVSAEHTDEHHYAYHLVKGRVGPAWMFDAADWSYQLWTGPILQQSNTTDGIGPEKSRTLSLAIEANLLTHTYEYYRDNPRSGYALNLQLERMKKDLGSDLSANRVVGTATSYWNLRGLTPPVWILGLRFALKATLPDDDTTVAELPASYRNFLGGARDLKGFGRQALPPDGAGAKVTAYTGSELRMANSMPYQLEPLLLADAARIRGVTDPDVESSLFWSPGLGLDWRSAIGTFRATFSHGMVAGPAREALDYLTRWEFFCSYGGQLW